MFDTMTITKIAASLCGALLILLLGKWAAEGLYYSGGHGEQAYVIDTGAEQEVDEGPTMSIEEMMASAEVESGAKVFRKCSACHKVEDGVNSTGPTLYGVVGRDIASVAGFGSYSSTLSELPGDWTIENLNAFLENPKGWANGTSMSFAGLPKMEDRADLIAYLQSVSN
jgi:cytochrome c